MDEQIRGNPIVEGCQHNFIIHLAYKQGFPVETTNEIL